MTIVKRGTKGTALTYAEMDENIRDLYEDTDIDRVLLNGNTTTKNLTTGTLSDSKGEIRSVPQEIKLPFKYRLILFEEKIQIRLYHCERLITVELIFCM